MACTLTPFFGLCAQVSLCIAAFTCFSLPVGKGIGTQFLEWLVNAAPELVSIRSIDEAVIIAAALSMSSSAFVLQLLAERGEGNLKFASATLGILLFQVRSASVLVTGGSLRSSAVCGCAALAAC